MSLWTRFEDVVNVPVYRKVRRIDVILVVGGILCVAFYWYTSGWQWAILGGLMYLMFMMIGLWML